MVPQLDEGWVENFGFWMKGLWDGVKADLQQLFPLAVGE